MATIPYIEEILSQPVVLKAMLQNYDRTLLDEIRRAVQSGRFDRIILTGMGASIYGVYPAYLLLAGLGLPVHWLDAAELLHYSPALIGSRTLLWITSQSGRSAELIPLIDYSRSPRPGLLLATVNDLSSPLASTADITIPIDAPTEKTVSTRTYLNTLAITQLAALAITVQDASELTALLNEAQADCVQAADIIADYLKNWQDQVAILKETLSLPEHLIILGRGPSLASVLCGSLILAEAGKMPSIAMNAAEYRHGPLEMVGPKLTFMVFNGAAATAALNQKLVSDLLGFKAKAFILHDQPVSGLPLIRIPASTGIALPISEMITMQLLTIAFAELQGLEPGKFYRGDKVVLVE